MLILVSGSFEKLSVGWVQVLKKFHNFGNDEVAVVPLDFMANVGNAEGLGVLHFRAVLLLFVTDFWGSQFAFIEEKGCS